MTNTQHAELMAGINAIRSILERNERRATSPENTTVVVPATPPPNPLASTPTYYEPAAPVAAATRGKRGRR